MKVSLVIVCLLVACAAYAADPAVVTVDLGAVNPGSPRTYAVPAGDVNIKLKNVLPNKVYEVAGENRRQTVKLDESKKADKDECSAGDDQIARRLAAKLEEKKGKAKATDKEAPELAEADMAEVLATDFGCGADKKKFEADKKKYDEDQAKFDQGTEKPAAEKKRLDDEKKRLEEVKKTLDAEAATLAQIRDRFVINFDGYSLKDNETLTKTFKRVGDDATWTIVVTTQGGSAATTAAAAEKAANPVAAESTVLNRLLNTTATHPDLIVGSCKYTDATCAAKIYINADQISTLTISEIPKQGGLTVRVTGGEYFPCQAVSYNIARYSAAPDTLIFPLHMKKGVAGIGSTSVHRAEAEAASIYGLDWCPGTDRIIQKTAWYRKDRPMSDIREEVRARNLGITDMVNMPDPRSARVKAPPIAALPLFLRGKSQVVEVEFDWDDGTHKTFTFPVVYQRFWLDAGGFFVFTRRTDQSLDLENLGGTPEHQLVRAIRRDVSIEPATGIVINVHPGNFPILAFQFGIAATQGKSPSYYGGIGVRAREIGKRGLATVGVGVAMQQEDHFPNIEYLGIYESTSARLKPVAKYGLTFPYISFSLGFSFGGVSEKTNVADSVQSPQQ